MIEYIFAVALGIGSVVIATIGLAELSGHEKKKEEIRVSADYIKKQGNIGEIKINDETYRYMTNQREVGNTLHLYQKGKRMRDMIELIKTDDGTEYVEKAERKERTGQEIYEINIDANRINELPTDREDDERKVIKYNSDNIKYVFVKLNGEKEGKGNPDRLLVGEQGAKRINITYLTKTEDGTKYIGITKNSNIKELSEKI